MNKTIFEIKILNAKKTIQIRQGDITLEDSEAIVNPANSELAHGGGVAGAIVRRGGMIIQEESNQWVREKGSVPTGGVAVTGAGSLKCKHVIHAVGPVWHGGDKGEKELLRNAVWNSLDLAHEMGIKSISIPAISSGIFGFPKELCAEIIVQTVLDFFNRYQESPLMRVALTNIDNATVEIFTRTLREGNRFDF